MTVVMQTAPAAVPAATVHATGEAIDPRAFRAALGQFTTGVTVITALAPDGALVGITANSFNALSLDPPLVLWSLRESSPSLHVFEQSDRFVVNVLSEAQIEVSRRFASSIADKFDGVPHAESAHGLPLLHSAAAWFECRTLVRQKAGDHVLYIAEVDRFTASEQAPLVFHSGGYHALGSRL